MPDVPADQLATYHRHVAQRLLNVAAWYYPQGLADPAELTATDQAIAEAFRDEAERWRKRADALSGEEADRG